VEQLFTEGHYTVQATREERNGTSEGGMTVAAVGTGISKLESSKQPQGSTIGTDATAGQHSAGTYSGNPDDYPLTK